MHEKTYTIAVATAALQECGIDLDIIGIEEDVEVAVFPAKEWQAPEGYEAAPKCFELLEEGLSLIVPQDLAVVVTVHED